MNNVKWMDSLLELLNERIEFIIEELEYTANPNSDKEILAAKLSKDFISARCNYYLKHYNNDESKMDNFIFNKIVEEFRVFNQKTLKVIDSQFENSDLISLKKYTNMIVNELETLRVTKKGNLKNRKRGN